MGAPRKIGVEPAVTQLLAAVGKRLLEPLIPWVNEVIGRRRVTKSPLLGSSRNAGARFDRGVHNRSGQRKLRSSERPKGLRTLSASRSNVALKFPRRKGNAVQFVVDFRHGRMVEEAEPGPWTLLGDSRLLVEYIQESHPHAAGALRNRPLERPGTTRFVPIGDILAFEVQDELSGLGVHFLCH